MVITTIITNSDQILDCKVGNAHLALFLAYLQWKHSTAYLSSMPSPFAGMDLYLEHPSAWPNVHHRLITAIADDLAPQLLPKYQVLIEERISVHIHGCSHPIG